jgi:hypothetical protein
MPEASRRWLGASHTTGIRPERPTSLPSAATFVLRVVETGSTDNSRARFGRGSPMRMRHFNKMHGLSVFPPLRSRSQKRLQKIQPHGARDVGTRYSLNGPAVCKEAVSAPTAPDECLALASVLMGCAGHGCGGMPEGARLNGECGLSPSLWKQGFSRVCNAPGAVPRADELRVCFRMPDVL